LITLLEFVTVHVAQALDVKCSLTYISLIESALKVPWIDVMQSVYRAPRGLIHYYHANCRLSSWSIK